MAEKSKKSGSAHVYKNIWTIADQSLKERIYDFSDDYKLFLDNSKTEREAVVEIVKRAKDMGFIDLEVFLEEGGIPSVGDKFYIVNKKKAVCLIVMGEEELEKGFRGIGSHLDSPRLDLKHNTLYQEEDMAYFKTHYYGGIKKYQWLATPLSIHGTVVKKGGECVEISIGESDEDPVFFIADLLPHLGQDQAKKTLREAVAGESLNLLVGSEFSSNEDVEFRAQEKVYELLKEKYDIEAGDLMSSEIQIVPAGKSRDLGFDKSLILAYGHDDKCCAYASMQAIFEVERPKNTCIAVFVDKEEIGSVGSTSVNSMFFERVLSQLISSVSDEKETLRLHKALGNSKFLSADVTAALDPNYPEVLDKYNAARINYGVCISRYTGSGGKYSTNDVNAEFLREVVDLFDVGSVLWQTGEFGKVDQGGAGTIAGDFAKYGGEVVDVGIATLSMHGTYEVISKADLYMTYKAYHSFFRNILI